MPRHYSLPDLPLCPPEDAPPPCPHCGLDPACDCEPDFDPPDDWREDDDYHDPVSRPRSAYEIEDARLCPLPTCATCGRRLRYAESDWPGDGELCQECAEVAAELASEDCAESDSCARLRTGT